MVGIAAMCWALWLNRNDMIFQKATANSFLQVIFRGAYWIRQWSQLSKEEEKGALMEGCQRLEVGALHLFSGHAWKNRRRIKE